jgi:hypothetical protein
MRVPAESVARAREADILEVARRYGTLCRVGGAEYAGPCPVCGGKDRFSVNTKKRLWNCRKCGRGGDVISLGQHADGATFAQAVAALSGEGEALAGFKASQLNLDRPGDDDDKAALRQHKKASWLWAQRSPLAGSIAETYLRKARGYHGPVPATLGFLRPFKDYPPALIAAFAMPGDDPGSGALVAPKDVGAVHLIALKADGSGKADIEVPKRTIGSPGGLPIVVAPVNDLLGLAITEGLEDALSVYEGTGLGVWAAAGACFMPRLAAAVASYVECATIFAHPDETGRTNALMLAQRLADRGLEVFVEGAG